MKRVVVLVATLLAVALLPACGSSKPKAAPPQPPVDARGKKHVDISADTDANGAYVFTPAEVIITPGTQLTWHNNDDVAHNVKKAVDSANFGGPFGVDAGDCGPGAVYSFTFSKVGDYPYACTIHTGMNGRVRVEKAS